jgi:HEAT repeat protein
MRGVRHNFTKSAKGADARHKTEKELGATVLREFLEGACLLLAACLLPVLFNHSLERRIHDPGLRWAAAISLAELLSTGSMCSYLLCRRAYHRFQATIQDQIRPPIEDRIMALALDGAAWSGSVPRHGPARRALELSLAHGLVSLKDSPRERLSRFAVEHGFASHWEKSTQARSPNERKRAIALLALVCSDLVRSDMAGNKSSVAALHRALHDSDAAVRAEAARALLLQGDPSIVDRVFRSVLRDGLLTRILLLPDLKRHARYLLTETIPALLAQSDLAENGKVENLQPDTLHALQILSLWKRAVPTLNATLLLARHAADARVLPLVLALLPYLAVDDSVEGPIREALASCHLEVQIAAARAAGQLQLSGLIPALSELLSGAPSLATEAALALSRTGEAGIRALESALSGSRRSSAGAALEALEQFSVGTC